MIGNIQYEYLPLQYFQMRAIPRNLAWHLSVQVPLMRCLPHYPTERVRVIYGVQTASSDNHSRGTLKQDLLWNIVILSDLISCIFSRE